MRALVHLLGGDSCIEVRNRIFLYSNEILNEKDDRLDDIQQSIGLVCPLGNLPFDNLLEFGDERREFRQRGATGSEEVHRVQKSGMGPFSRRKSEAGIESRYVEH